jgi:tetratricopeptide (TPR) repeat protein
MPESKADDITQPIPRVVDQTRQMDNSLRARITRAARSGSVGPWILAIPVFLIILIGVSAVMGYSSGLDLREQTELSQVSQAIKEQFDLGVEDLVALRFEIAQQRFEYVLTLNPDYPGAAEYLGMALQALNQPTPTPAPTISPTPSVTPDLRSFEGMFQSAQAAFNRGDWSEALNIFLLLRASDPAYQLDEVNRMMALALRNRGMDKLFSGDIEQGIYDLNLAERFGPLDNQAQSWRRSASFYMFANSYFGLDWALSAEYFGQICVANIWGACYKYGESAREYGHLLLKDEDFCGASFYYGESLNQRGDASLAPTATEVAGVCLTAIAPTATPTETPTETPTGTFFFTPTSTATFAEFTTPTLTPTVTPTTPEGITATPTPTPTTPSADTPAPTATRTLTEEASPTPTLTPTVTPSDTQTPTEEPTDTPEA